MNRSEKKNFLIFITLILPRFVFKLKSDSVAGPDDIPPILIKKCAPELAPILSKLFQLSYESDVFPESRKIARVIPIPKKADSSQITNYRSIAITPVLSKIMEMVINQHVLRHLENNKIIHHRQYEFRQCRSTS